LARRNGGPNRSIGSVRRPPPRGATGAPNAPEGYTHSLEAETGVCATAIVEGQMNVFEALDRRGREGDRSVKELTKLSGLGARPRGYTDAEWEAALAAAQRLGYPPSCPDRRLRA
jgi:hypothetical protein